MANILSQSRGLSLLDHSKFNAAQMLNKILSTFFTQPLDAITNRSATDGTAITSSLSDSDLDAAKTVATGAEIAFVFITG